MNLSGRPRGEVGQDFARVRVENKQFIAPGGPPRWMGAPTKEVEAGDMLPVHYPSERVLVVLQSRPILEGAIRVQRQRYARYLGSHAAHAGCLRRSP